MNESELKKVAENDLESDEAVLAKSLVAKGVEAVIVTLGAKG